MPLGGGTNTPADRSLREAELARVHEIRDFSLDELLHHVSLDDAVQVHQFFMRATSEDIVATISLNSERKPDYIQVMQNNTASYDDIVAGLDDMIFDSPKMRELLAQPDSPERSAAVRTLRSASALILITWHQLAYPAENQQDVA